MKRAWHLVGLAGDGDLPFLHRLQQRRLHFRRRAVDLVGKNEIGEDWPLLELELAAFLRLYVDFRAGHVRRQQVGCELNARQIGGEIFGERFHRSGFGETRQAFDQEIAVGEQPDQHALDQMILTEHGLTHADLEVEDGLARGRGHRPRGSRHGRCNFCIEISHFSLLPVEPAGTRPAGNWWGDYFEIDFINPSTIWSMLKLAGRWLGG